MKKAILVTGSNGQLGWEIQKLAKLWNQYQFLFATKEDLDITNPNSLENFLEKLEEPISLKGIINAAAYTAVDKAESEPELAMEVNGIAPGYLAKKAKEYRCKFIHISTDFVFDGTKSKPYTEEDIKNPISIYGKTKSEGEENAIKVNQNTIIIRTSWVYSEHGKNFVKTILKLANERKELNIIYDQIGTPTWARDLAEVCLQIVDTDKIQYGIYNYSNQGVASWYDFAHAILDMSSIKCKINPIPTEKYPTPAKRPHYSVLSKEKIQNELNLTIPYWRDSLRNCINDIKLKA